MTWARRLRPTGRTVLSAAALVGGMVLPATAFAQKLGQAADDGISVWRILAVLLLCLVLAVAGAFVLRSGMARGTFAFSPSRKARRLALVESLRLGPQTSLCIVNCDGKELLIAISAQGTRLLSSLPVGNSTAEENISL